MRCQHHPLCGSFCSLVCNLVCVTLRQGSVWWTFDTWLTHIIGTDGWYSTVQSAACCLTLLKTKRSRISQHHAAFGWCKSRIPTHTWGLCLNVFVFQFGKLCITESEIGVAFFFFRETYFNVHVWPPQARTGRSRLNRVRMAVEISSLIQQGGRGWSTLGRELRLLVSNLWSYQLRCNSGMMNAQHNMPNELLPNPRESTTGRKNGL